MKEAFIKLTERRLVQCPHLTVTTIDKLVNGTLTCITHIFHQMIIHLKMEREEREEVKVYQENSGAKTTLDVANLPRQIKQMVECGHVGHSCCHRERNKKVRECTYDE